MRRRPTDRERADIEKSIPRFTLRSRSVYEAAAEELRASGAQCTWTDLRLADMQAHFPRRDAIRDTATVRAVHLWSLAYYRQLVDDLDAPEDEVRSAAMREIERITHGRAKPLDHVHGGKA